MIFTHANEATTTAISNCIGKAQSACCCQRFWYITWRLAVEALVWKMGEIDGSLIYDKRTSSVLVYARARIKWDRSNLRRAPVRSPADDNVPPTFCWSQLSPVDLVTV